MKKSVSKLDLSEAYFQKNWMKNAQSVWQQRVVQIHMITYWIKNDTSNIPVDHEYYVIWLWNCNSVVGQYFDHE